MHLAYLTRSKNNRLSSITGWTKARNNENEESVKMVEMNQVEPVQ